LQPLTTPSIQELLTLWRETHEPRVAAVLLAKDPLFVSARLQAFDKERVASRLTFYDSAEPDPRLARVLLKVILRCRPVESQAARDVETRAIELLPKHSDMETVERLARIIRVRQASVDFMPRPATVAFDAKLDAALASLRKVVLPSTMTNNTAKAQCDEWLLAARREAAQPATMTASERLYAAIYADPSDDAPREVLADHLQSTNDPHGELITLQLAATRTDLDAESLTKLERRMRALLPKYGARFVAKPVWRCVSAKSIRFERGFPAIGFIQPKSEDALSNAMSSPAWSTFHTLALSPFAGWGTSLFQRIETLDFLTQSTMRHIQRVGPIRRAEAIALISYGQPVMWRELAIEDRSDNDEQVRFMEAFESAAEKIFPNLEHLALDISEGTLESLRRRAPWVTDRAMKFTLASDLPSQSLSGIFGVR